MSRIVFASIVTGLALSPVISFAADPNDHTSVRSGRGESAAKPATSAAAREQSTRVRAEGIVRPEGISEVYPLVAGTIMQLHASPGMTVAEGYSLATIDRTVYQAQVEQAQASVVRKQAELMQAKARCNYAENALQRAERAVKSSAISQDEYELTAQKCHEARANLALADGAVRESQSLVQAALRYLDATMVRSPTSGVVLQSRARLGQYVAPDANSPALWSIGDLRLVRVVASVKESDFARIHVGQTATFTVDAYPDEIFHGKVMQIELMGVIRQDGTVFHVLVATENRERKLLPNFTAHVLFE
jgi:HlyD family secretion protein